MVHSYSVRLVPRPLPARPSLLPTPHHPARADVRRTWLTVTRCGSTLARCPLVPRSYPPRTTPFGPTFVGHGSQLLGAARPSPAARSSLAPTCGAMKSCNTLSMSDLRVSEIWRYPIKSVGGERVSVATVTELGVLGDRSWGIFDVDTGTVLTARRTPELLFASAALTGADVAITLPDGTVISSANETCNQQLSSWLNRKVELLAAGEEGGTYEVPLDFENDENWVSWQGPGGAWHDSKASRVSLVSRDTMCDWDQRRFRANVILDGSGEDGLVGAHVSLGTTELAVMKPIDRCVIVTRPQPGLDRDLDVLRTINAERATTLSVGALVVTEGTISQGDAVTSV